MMTSRKRNFIRKNSFFENFQTKVIGYIIKNWPEFRSSLSFGYKLFFIYFSLFASRTPKSEYKGMAISDDLSILSQKIEF